MQKLSVGLWAGCMHTRREKTRTFSQNLLSFLFRDALDANEILLRGICDGFDGMEPCVFQFLNIVRVDASLLQFLHEHRSRDLERFLFLFVMLLRVLRSHGIVRIMGIRRGGFGGLLCRDGGGRDDPESSLKRGKCIANLVDASSRGRASHVPIAIFLRHSVWRVCSLSVYRKEW